MISFKEYLLEIYKSIDPKMPKHGAGLGIKRADMPQVASKDYDDYLKFLKKHGVTLKLGKEKASKLKPIQKEFSHQGVKISMGKTLKHIGDKQLFKKPIIVSKDGYIIDGHHRWLAHKNMKTDLHTLRANVNMKELLTFTKQFPKTTYKDIYTK